MKTPTHFTASLFSCAVLAVNTLAMAEGNPDREVYFGQTHSHTSWSIDAYLIGNHQVDPEQAYQYSLGMPVKHPMGFEAVSYTHLTLPTICSV